MDLSPGTQLEWMIEQEKKANLAARRGNPFYRIATLEETVASLSRRNKIINGDFRINQRGCLTGDTLTGYFFDRWKSRGNLVLNPRAATNLTGWATATGAAGAPTRVATGGPIAACPAFARLTITNGAVPLSLQQSQASTLLPGKTYRLSAYMRTSAALTITLDMLLLMVTGGIAYDSTNSAATALTPNVWTRLDVGFTTPSSYTAGDPHSMIIRVIASAAMAVSQTFDMTGLLLEESSSLNAYKDPAVVTFTAAPQGQPLTLSADAIIGQPIERSDLPAGSYAVSWEGTATGRLYKDGTVPGAFEASGFTAAIDGLGDYIMEVSTSAGVTATVWRVQVEKAATPSPFEELPHQQALALCQRFKHRLSSSAANVRLAMGIQIATTSTEFLFWFPVTMRRQPQVTITTTLWVTDGVGFNSVISNVWNSWPQTGEVDELQIYAANATAGAQFRPVFLSCSDTAQYVDFDAEM